MKMNLYIISQVKEKEIYREKADYFEFKNNPYELKTKKIRQEIKKYFFMILKNLLKR